MDALACARCGNDLYMRTPDSIGRTWALLIAACILYILANVLPVMETGSLFGTQTDTIMSGVAYLWTSGSWPIAVVVFFASVAVPLLKILALAFLLISVQRRSAWQSHQRARLYRLVEYVGRWSMLDIYVVTILTALVQIQSLAMIRAGPGAVVFGAVVVLTMFAACLLGQQRSVHDATYGLSGLTGADAGPPGGSGRGGFYFALKRFVSLPT